MKKMNKLDKPLIETILILDRSEISGIDPVILQNWLRSLSTEVLELRLRKPPKDENIIDSSWFCDGCM